VRTLTDRQTDRPTAKRQTPAIITIITILIRASAVAVAAADPDILRAAPFPRFIMSDNIHGARHAVASADPPASWPVAV